MLDTVSINISVNLNTNVNDFETTRKLISLKDIFGRNSKPKKNTPLFYRYNDGSIEKKFIID